MAEAHPADGEALLEEIGGQEIGGQEMTSWGRETAHILAPSRPEEEEALVPRPATLQEVAEQEALRWGAEWLCDEETGSLPWPADMGGALPPLSVDRLVGALRSFPLGTGLGWDKMHPRAWLRLGDAVLTSLLHFFVLVEATGR